MPEDLFVCFPKRPFKTKASKHQVPHSPQRSDDTRTLELDTGFWIDVHLHVEGIPSGWLRIWSLEVLVVRLGPKGCKRFWKFLATAWMRLVDYRLA